MKKQIILSTALLVLAACTPSPERPAIMNKEIIEKKRTGVSAWASSSAPGERDPNLFMLGGSPRAPHTVQELEAALTEEMEKLKKDGPTELELEKVRNNLASGFRWIPDRDIRK